MDKGESEQPGEERSYGDGDRVVHQEEERSKQDEKTPDRTENDPSRAFRCGDHLNVAEIESLVTLD